MESTGQAEKVLGQPFRKGQSGNPGGRPAGSAEVRQLARRHTASALGTLVEIALHGKSEAARVAAASALLDRGWGRPRPAPQQPNLPEQIQFTIKPYADFPASADQSRPPSPPPGEA